METKDLRRGNYLDRNGLMKVWSISPMRIKIYDCVNKCVIDHMFFISSFKPIPLTEECLLKFRFRKRKACGNYWFEKKIKGILFLTNDINPKIGLAFSVKLEHVFIHDIDDAVRFKYVHSLQNIVFTLTGTELEMK